MANVIEEIYRKNINGILHFSSIDRISRYDFALLIADAFTLKSDLIRHVSMNEMKWTAKRPRDSSLSVEKSAILLEKKPLKVGKRLF